jgi:7-carboxy-7-deazaguanine synthase
MQINEIFYSLQGEGKLTGLPTIFIRTSQCNLRCSFCDTAYSYEKGTEMDIETILQEIKKYHCSQVCITGGEPLLQQETIELLQHLQQQKYACSIETNGSIDISPLLSFKSLVISCDIKCPSSEMNDRMDLENINRLRAQDQIKFVIGDKQDFSYAVHIIKQSMISCPIYIQPIWGCNLEMIASWILEEHLPIRLGLQQHKYIWADQSHR